VVTLTDWCVREEFDARTVVQRDPAPRIVVPGRWGVSPGKLSPAMTPERQARRESPERREAGQRSEQPDRADEREANARRTARERAIYVDAHVSSNAKSDHS
jgi:hypothetical protein